MALTDKLKAIGNAIRAKTGGTEELTLDQMVTEIEGIEGGSGGGSDGSTHWENLYINGVAEYALYGCKSLHTVNIGNVIRIGTHGFSKCKNLTEIRIENNAIIDDYAFSECENLKTLNSQGSLLNVGRNAFERCVSLKNIDLTFTNNIGIYAFNNCESLPYVRNISMQRINENAFFGCRSLTTADFEQVSTIEAGAFCFCESLSALILRTTEDVCVADFSAFEETPMLTGEGHIYVPAAMYEYYRAGYEPALEQGGMGGFFDILFRKIEDYPEICG
jgi:hypothetical protein